MWGLPGSGIDCTHISCTGRQILYTEPPEKPETTFFDSSNIPSVYVYFVLCQYSQSKFLMFTVAKYLFPLILLHLFYVYKQSGGLIVNIIISFFLSNPIFWFE